METYRDFFYETGRFLGNSTIVSVLRERIPSFIESRDVLSPLALYDTYAGCDMRGIVSVQFLAALNIFLGGDGEQSRDAMSELFHNLSWQALTNDNDRHQMRFGHISILVQSINQRIQKYILEHRRKTADINFKIVSQLDEKQVVNEESQFEIDKIEQKIIDDIINENETVYGTPSPPPTIKTEEQIDHDRRQKNEDFLKTELAKNQRDIEIIQDIDAKNKADQIKSLVVPVDGELPTTNEEIISSDYTKSDHNKSQHPLVDPNVLRLMQEIVHNPNAFVNEPDPNLAQITFEDNSTPPKDPPKKKKPTLQEILTEQEEQQVIREMVKIKEKLVPPAAEEIGLAFPERTGIRSVDERNYDDYLDTSQQIRPDLFIDEEDDYVEPNGMNALVPINVETTSNDTMDVVARPDVLVTLPPIVPTIPNQKRTFAPPSPPRDDFYISDDKDDNKKLLIVMGTDKIVITKDGDVQLTELDNMQVEDKPIIALTDGTVAQPPT